MFFFFNDTATTEIYTLSLHDALPIWYLLEHGQTGLSTAFDMPTLMGYDSDHHRSVGVVAHEDRKSTRLNSSHGYISYAVFCLKKKKGYTQSPSCTTERTTTWPA